MRSLKWNQVNAWRLSQHGLSPRLRRRDYVKAMTRTGGIQAQVMSAAELALGARVDGLTAQDVQAALWQERTLVKTWAMRATLHLISADELPLYVAALSVYEVRNWLKNFTYYGITLAQYEAFLAAVPQILGGEPMTREQLATAVARHIGAPELGRLLLSSSWGSLWKPSAWRGDLCFGPNQGRNVTFVRPSQWIGQWQAVEVEGWRAVALRTTLEPMQRLEITGAVRLLPLFDAYTLGLGRKIAPLLPEAYVGRVFRPQGWISAVVLVDGYMKGVWEYQRQRAQTVVKVHLFSSPTAAIQQGIEAEAERLSAFLNSKVVLEEA